MRFFVLACDYDGTIAHHGVVSPEMIAALRRFVDTGRRLVLVTGRELDELLEIFPEIDLFEWVVAENGAVLYRGSDREEKLLAEPPPESFVRTLRQRGVAPFSVGRVIVATWEPNQTVVLDAIRDHGLDLQVIFNKGAVMVLPAGVNKASGFLAALRQMGLSQHEAVGVGDAENDHAFLSLCECSVAVANALPAVKARAHFVTKGDHGEGVAELIDQIVNDDLAAISARMLARELIIGLDAQGREATLPAFGPGVLIAGPSGSGKSTTTTSLLERLVEQHYQFCVIDPEGDYDSLSFAITVGTADNGPSVREVLQVLAQPDQNVVVNLIGLRLSDRPAFFSKLMPQLLELREQSGRPHWLIVDEAHHLLPPAWDLATAFAKDLGRAVFITVNPDQVNSQVLSSVGTVIAVGASPDKTLRTYCRTQKIQPPTLPGGKQESGQVVVWSRSAGSDPLYVRVAPNAVERKRHIRKYAEGELPPDRSFYFKGPAGKLNLRAQNLMLFLQLSDGVDDDTWLHHLRSGDYSEWFRRCIKDDVLAGEARAIESLAEASAETTRSLMRKSVEHYYTLPIDRSRLSEDKDLTANAEAEE
ncbi:HAD-IIB family hydrolase [Planctellipticum variicoloris]|uniref:HAD-IIB family hydrolase n=1 Tax=Planctellipticum variicoloris TaxID=3064265 RepID=UPI003013BE20|nr:HAD-IIB family hydrolase [Planctomycetaceae bacterium SH412]